MTVAENMFLGREPRKRNVIVDAKAVNQEAQVVLDYLQLNVAPTTPVARLSVAQQQMVEIARALTLNAKLIIMDEPSAALSDSEVESLHRVVRELKGRGVSIIYVTHRLHEVFQLCDRFTVFQDGRFTGSGAVAETNVEQLIRLMVGRDVAFNRRPPSETHHEDKPIRLAVKGCVVKSRRWTRTALRCTTSAFTFTPGRCWGLRGWSAPAYRSGALSFWR
ncbi:ABC transporter ATP-binding protein [Citrobacter koseri]|nr:ABC transporter ATP-binding protein [Citrobacter koseri]